MPGGLLMCGRCGWKLSGLDGKTQVIVRAPQCTYAPLDGVANSAGHMELQSGDGKIHVQGDGFLWRQTTSALDHLEPCADGDCHAGSNAGRIMNKIIFLLTAMFCGAARRRRTGN